VLFYWTTSNLWTMGQQFYVIRNNPAPGTEAARAKEERDKKKALKHGGVAVVEEEPEPEPEKRPAQRVQPQRQPRSTRKAAPKPTADGVPPKPAPHAAPDPAPDPAPDSGSQADASASNGQAITPRQKKKNVPAKGAPSKAVPTKKGKKR
jgi:hypothetical protein